MIDKECRNDVTDCNATDLRSFFVRLSAGLALMIILQSFSLLYWAGTISARVNKLEQIQMIVLDRLYKMPPHKEDPGK